MSLLSSSSLQLLSGNPYLAEGMIASHHEDEGKHRNADPRVIKVPTGSCSSLVALQFADSLQQMPAELARMLVSSVLPVFPLLQSTELACSAILIDTGNMKPPPGKAEKPDVDAMQMLTQHLFASDQGFAAADNRDKDKQQAWLDQRFSQLKEKKFNIGHLSGRDLLRRVSHFLRRLKSRSNVHSAGLQTIHHQRLSLWTQYSPSFP